MKSTVEHLNPTRVKLTVEVPFDELRPHFDKAYKGLAGQVRIPGFRPGKVPARILDARLGRGAILSEVVNEAVPIKYGEAVSEANLTVLGQPEIEVTKIEDGDSLAFTAEVDVRPEITLPDASAITVQVDDIEVTDADIDEQVEALQERFATVTAVERPAAEGDTVTIDLSATVGEEEIEDAKTEGLTYTVGTGDLVDGLDAAIGGLTAGESTTFGTKLVAGEHAGEDAQVTVTVTGVSERNLPEVDDDFAQLASEFDTVEEMRADLTERIRRVKNVEQGSQARDKVLEALLEATDIPAPEGIVKAEYDARQHDAVHSFDHDEDAFNAYLEGEGQTREEFDAEAREASEQAVRTQLLLDALADQQAVQVSQEEFTERIIYNAQRFGLAPDDYFRRLQEANQLGSVIADVRRGKALATAVQQATVTDASGATLDVAALFGIEDAPELEDGTVEGSVETVESVEGSVETAEDAAGSSEDAESTENEAAKA
ncbi:trigger factor [Nakamurella sp. YIM 132087]|uniref:Trigger factor n=1 Tax=Nakamurella alba TaxID=2665158 RepID=A0A7K1FH82_9ACTN|nr:trigger factor [Nakamurella alba]MTD13487.1 trigger factor [Nakamurella alba]